MVRYEFVADLPDLILPEQYADDVAGRRVCVRIGITAEGVVILGDAVCPERLEALLESLDVAVIEQTLCG